MNNQSALFKFYILIVIYLISISGGPNLLITVLSFSTLLFIIELYKQYNPPVILLGIIMQWLSITIELIYCNAFGITLSDKIAQSGKWAYGSKDNIEYACYLSQLGLIAYSVGILITTNKVKKYDNNTIDNMLFNYSAYKIAKLYFIVFILSTMLTIVLFSSAGLTQFLNLILIIKWGLFFLMVYFCIKQKQSIYLMSLIILVEFTLGFVSYFSNSFASIFIFTFLALISTDLKMKTRTIILIVTISGFAIYTALLWTSVKVKYRDYLNQGNKQQVVKVEKGDALTKFYELATNVDNNALKYSIFDLVNRIGYITFFSRTLEYIPSSKPFEGGSLYWEAISHYLKPRLFFPDKKSIDDSNHTREYTGLTMSGSEGGTSISLGYMADAYVDFGPIGMVIPLFLVGAITGLIYRYFQKMNIQTVWKLVIITPFFFLINVYSFNAIKVIGPLFIFAIFGPFVMKYSEKYLDVLIRK